MASTNTLFVGEWSVFVKKLSIGGLSEQLLNQSIVQKAEPDALYLQLEKQHAGLMQRGTIKKIEYALKSHFNRTIKLEITLENSELNTPARQKQEAEKLQQQSARNAIESDLIVQKLCNALDGQIQIDSIRSVDVEEF